MDKSNPIDKVCLHRYAVISRAINERLTKAERGQIVRDIASQSHSDPNGQEKRYSRGTIDRWVSAYRKGGFEALSPTLRKDTGSVRSHPELFEQARALRRELPTRSAAQIASIVFQHNKISISERTIREHLARQGLTRRALEAEPKVFGRYEASHPNERWITDVLVGPFVPYPRQGDSVRARLFLIVDDHSRLIIHGRFYAHENTRSGQDTLCEAIRLRGLPSVLYCDNGAPFANAHLTRTCAVLGIRLVHSKPYSPQGRGKQERVNRYIREAFLAEAIHQGISSLDELNDLFEAWVSQVANTRIHKETKERPIDRFEASGPYPTCDSTLLKEAFLWSSVRKVTKTGTVSLEGNSYSVDPVLVSRRVELRYDPKDLSDIDVYYEGKSAGKAVPFKIGRHVAKKAPQLAKRQVDPTGIDYLSLLAKTYEEQSGTGAKVDFSQLAMFDDGSDKVL